MNNTHRRTLAAIWADPVNGNLEWPRIEGLFTALGCRTVEGPGSSVTFEYQGSRATFHRPHPGREALRYRVKAAREFLEKIGAKP
ncbi:MAG: type II toxin-antitoxin system HicA family toxin [Nitrococcus sp.]|nr:type II toxin-antitoxin system HicA family toxin [Nitrococcus sp.]